MCLSKQSDKSTFLPSGNTVWFISFCLLYMICFFLYVCNGFFKKTENPVSTSDEALTIDEMTVDRLQIARHKTYSSTNVACIQAYSHVELYFLLQSKYFTISTLTQYNINSVTHTKSILFIATQTRLRLKNLPRRPYVVINQV